MLNVKFFLMICGFVLLGSCMTSGGRRVQDTQCESLRARSIPRGAVFVAERGHQRIYLFGSIHIAHKDDAQINPFVLCLFDSVKTVGFEMDLSLKDFEATLAEVTKERESQLGRPLMHYPAGDGLSKHVDASVATKLQERAKDHPDLFDLKVHAKVVGHEITLDSFTPEYYSAINMAMATHVLGRSLNLTWTTGIDFALFERAKKMRKNRVALETAREQLRMYASLSDLDDNANAKLILDEHVDRLIDDMKQLYEIWKSGAQARQMDQLLQKMPASSYNKMFSTRNVKMAEGISHCEESGGCFYVVGLGHLFGKQSIPDELKIRGFEVRRLL